MLPPRGQLESPFFRSKFRVPAVPGHVLHRARLVELLDDLAAYPVTAIVAPAGAGKTALAADWVGRTERPTAWLTLDDADRDPAQFWAAAQAAVEELAEAPGSVLVIDDVHRIDELPATDAALEEFVDRRPDWLHLLLLGRRRPPLPVDRLRATGALADIDFEVLRFSDDEALAMIAGLCPDTAVDDLPPIAEWADGWAAALQLAALAVRSRRQVPTGPDRLVDSYVWHEVLRGERAELVELLLSTAVVDRMNYGLAESLTGRPDAGDLLVEAEERGLFVTSLDPGGWFGVHGLVREMLVAELERRWPERLREQHLRAARWFEESGDGATALEHWLDAGEPAEALRLLSSLAPALVDGGRTAWVERVLQRIPPEVAEADATTRVQAAWCRLLVGAPGEPLPAGSGALDALAAYTAGDWPAAAARVVEGRALAEVVAGTATGAALAGELAAVPPTGSPDVALLRAAIAVRAGDLDEARTALDRADVPVSGGPRGVAASVVRLAWADAAGRPADMLAAAREARSRLAGLPAPEALTTATVATAEGVGQFRAGDLDAACVALGEAVSATTTADGPLHLRGLAELSLAEACAGRLTRALELTRAADRTAADQGVPVTTRPVAIELARAWVAVERQDFGQAQRSLARLGRARHGHDDETGRTITVLLRARYLRDRGDTRGARRELERASTTARWLRAHLDVESLGLGTEASAPAVVRVAVPGDPLADLLDAADRRCRDGDVVAARRELSRALKLGQAERLRRPFAHASPRVRSLIRTDDQVRARAAWLRPDDQVVADGTTTAGKPVEALTARELEVLRLLAAFLTTEQIAADLFISVHTVRTHVRRVLEKLSVSRRHDAVRRGQELGLV